MAGKKGKQVGQKLGFERYSFLYDNDHLRFCVKAFLAVKEKSLRSISRDLNLSPGDVSNYMNRKKRSLSDFHIIRLCDACGIEISLNVKLKDEE